MGSLHFIFFASFSGSGAGVDRGTGGEVGSKTGFGSSLAGALSTGAPQYMQNAAASGFFFPQLLQKLFSILSFAGRRIAAFLDRIQSISNYYVTVNLCTNNSVPESGTLFLLLRNLILLAAAEQRYGACCVGEERYKRVHEFHSNS